MAKIQKIELNLSQKIANTFKTTRKSTTNPFKYQDFEGNTLDVAAFADVFSGAKNVSKMKLISASVIGSFTRLRNRVTEPIINFVNRVKDGITGAWTYAKNTNIEIPGMKNLSDRIHGTSEGIHNIGKGLSDSISGIGKNITEGLSFLNKDVTDIGHELSEKWNLIIDSIKINRLHNEKINASLSVAELKELWIKENELTAKTIGINAGSKMEAKVA